MSNKVNKEYIDNVLYFIEGMNKDNKRFKNLKEFKRQLDKEKDLDDEYVKEFIYNLNELLKEYSKRIKKIV